MRSKRQRCEEEEEDDDEYDDGIELYRDFLANEAIEDDEGDEYVAEYNDDEDDEDTSAVAAGEGSEDGEYEIHTRSMQAFEYVELPEPEPDEEEEALPTFYPDDNDDEGENSSTDEANARQGDSDAEEGHHHHKKNIWELQNDDEEEDEEEEVWQEGDDDAEEEEEDEEEEDLIEEVEISAQELHELTTKAKTLLLPQDIKRIRQQVRTHIQLLCQVLMFSASGGKKMMFQTYARLLLDICECGQQTELEHAIFRPYVKPLQGLLARSHAEMDNTSLLVKDKPTWQMPIVHRFQQILTDFAPQLGFSSALYPKIPKQKHPLFSPEADAKRKNWRTWTDDELDLVLLGFERFGNERKLTALMHEHLLPSRKAHTITRLICEALGKRREESRFAPILENQRLAREGAGGVLLDEDEIARLKHAVAVQCRARRDLEFVCDIDFDKVSKDFLPHRSPYVLRSYYEFLCIKEEEKVEKAAEEEV